MSSTRYIALSAVLVTLAAARADAAPQPVRTLQYLVSGNGFGFQVFDASKMRITQFLERPYRYLRPRPDPKAEGYVRRNLAFDVYFGVRAGSSHGWLADSDTTVENLAAHLCSELQRKDPQSHYRVVAYEGVAKGAISESDSRPL